MKFTKMHGCGNDYVYVNTFTESVLNPAAVSKYVSDRHFGIGADGLILIGPSGIADFQMKMYNADGSEGSMCGNGIRCVAKYVYDYGLTNKTRIFVETKSGIKALDLTVENGFVSLVTVNMGAPILQAHDIPVNFEKKRVINEPVTVLNREYHITCVSMGNPHAVIIVENSESFPVDIIGPYFEHHEMFPERVNTEFVQVLNSTEIRMRVWERGSGETLACGTGTCASVVACVLNGYTDERVLVHDRGGNLEIFYDRANDTVWMTGPATRVFDGEIDLSVVGLFD